VARSSAAGSVREAIGAAVDALSAAGVQSPRLDAEVLLVEATGWERARLAAEPEAGLAAGAGRRFGEMVRRRLAREPVAYIIGRKWFRELELAVDRRVLIPRPETELLVELALKRGPASVLDVGTGSGAVALAIAAELPRCRVTATDTSPAALALARTNAQRTGLAGRVRFLAGSLPAGEHFELILANLPYVAAGEWPSLAPEVSEWEPREALLAGPDGLDAIRAFLAQLRRARSGGAQGAALPREIGLEVGAGQAGAVAGLLGSAGFGQVGAWRDLAGIERVIWGARSAFAHPTQTASADGR
jgi:release factor glutamine methyltransferase